MTLKELLDVVPDTYILGLTNAEVDNYSVLVFGRKKDAIWGFGQRSLLLSTQGSIPILETPICTVMTLRSFM